MTKNKNHLNQNLNHKIVKKKMIAVAVLAAHNVDVKS